MWRVENLGSIVSTVAGAVSVAGAIVLVFRWLYRRYRGYQSLLLELSASRRTTSELSRQLTESKATHARELDTLRDTHNHLRDVYLEMKSKYKPLFDSWKALRRGQKDAVLERERLAGEWVEEKDRREAALEEANRKVEEFESRLDDLGRSDGRLWLRPPTAPVPQFRPRSERKTIIVAVLNLKGGVGKTTLAANLAATVSTPGSRSLLIDLDYQRSLSMLLLSESDRKMQHLQGHTVQHFLNGEGHGADALLPMAKPIGDAAPHCSVVVNTTYKTTGRVTDGLEDTENRLMAEWLFDHRRADVRFFLREALHSARVGEEYGYAFLDCPPRLTTAGVNALAACDYVLVPTIPDPVSTRAVENLMASLREFRTLLPDFEVLGVVPNMFQIRDGKPIKDEERSLLRLRDALASKAMWHRPVNVFMPGIKDDAAFNRCALQLDAGEPLRLAVQEPPLAPLFQKLAKDMLKEMNA